jgi:hypothetical protein
VNLFRAGTLKKVLQQKYEINIAAVQEIQWQEKDIFDSDDCTVCKSVLWNRLPDASEIKEFYNGLHSSRWRDMLQFQVEL